MPLQGQLSGNTVAAEEGAKLGRILDARPQIKTMTFMGFSVTNARGGMRFQHTYANNMKETHPFNALWSVLLVEARSASLSRMGKQIHTIGERAIGAGSVRQQLERKTCRQGRSGVEDMQIQDVHAEGRIATANGW